MHPFDAHPGSEDQDPQHMETSAKSLRLKGRMLCTNWKSSYMQGAIAQRPSKTVAWVVLL